MSSRSLRVNGLVIATLLVTLTACADAGDLSIMNESPSDVTVLLGDDQATVTADGGVVLLDYGCTPGDVTVEFASGESVVAPGPVCPEHEIVIRDGAVDLEPASTDKP